MAIIITVYHTHSLNVSLKNGSSVCFWTSVLKCFPKLSENTRGGINVNWTNGSLKPKVRWKNNITVNIQLRNSSGSCLTHHSCLILGGSFPEWHQLQQPSSPWGSPHWSKEFRILPSHSPPPHADAWLAQRRNEELAHLSANEGCPACNRRSKRDNEDNLQRGVENCKQHEEHQLAKMLTAIDS